MTNWKEYLDTKETELRMLAIMEDLDGFTEIIDHTAETFGADKSAVASHIFQITQ